MITIEELQNAEFPFKLITSANSFIITQFTAIEERNSTYNSESKSLFLTNCRYVSHNFDVILAESHDCEIGNLKDLSIVKHDDVKFQSFFNRMKFIQINDLQYLAGLSDIVKERLTPKVPYVVISADPYDRNFDFRESIVNKEYVHSEDDSMFIVDNVGFKGAANFKVENSNIFNKSFSKFANYDNFIINVHDNYFPFYIFNKLKSWKGYNAVEKSLTFHFDKFKDFYNKIKNAGFPYIIEKLGNKEDLYVIARSGRNRMTYFKLFNLEENQTFSIAESNDVYNQLEENIIMHLDPGFTKYIFRLAHEYTDLAIPNDKLYLIYERKEEFPENKLPFAYYSKDNGNYIVFDRTDSGDYKAFDYKSNSCIVIPLSIVEQMFEHNSSNENSVILNTLELTKHHHYKISNFIEIAEMKKDKQKTKDKNTWNSTGIDLDKVLSENKKDTFKPLPEESKEILVKSAENEFFNEIIDKKTIEDVVSKLENIDRLELIMSTKEQEVFCNNNNCKKTINKLMEKPIVINRYENLEIPFIIINKKDNSRNYVVEIISTDDDEHYISYFKNNCGNLTTSELFIYDKEIHYIIEYNDLDFERSYFKTFYKENEGLLTEKIYKKLYPIPNLDFKQTVGKLFNLELLKKIDLPITLVFENNKHNVIIIGAISDTDLYVTYSYFADSFNNYFADEIDKITKDASFIGYDDILNSSDDYHIRMYNDLYRSNYINSESKNPELKKKFVVPGIVLDEVLSENKETSNLKLKSENTTGTKQSEGKLNYELDFEFITQLAERMAQNKGKYEPYNWKKPIPVEGLKQALFRHVMDYMANDNTLDDGREYGHLESIALNVMMINYQLKYNKQ